MHAKILVAAACLTFGCLEAAAAEKPITPNLEPDRRYDIEGSFTDEDGETAADISGIACMPPLGQARRHCLIVNDQDRSAQLATVDMDTGRLIAGAKVKLIAKKRAGAISGSPPDETACTEGKAGFKDLDGEGVAFAAPYFYVVGSHGCSRKKNKFHASSFVTARFRVDDQGRMTDRNGSPVPPSADPLDHVEATYRLSDVLRQVERAGPYFGKDLGKDSATGKDFKGPNGLNVEGVLVADGTLYAGLRAPSLDDTAFVIGTDEKDLFSSDAPASPKKPVVLSLTPGPNAGVRDLSPLPDGRLLVLTGPAQEQDVPYGLFIVEPRAEGKRIYLATLKKVIENGVTGKAEAVVVLDAKPDALRVLILFDSLPNGGPREYTVPIR